MGSKGKSEIDELTKRALEVEQAVKDWQEFGQSKCTCLRKPDFEWGSCGYCRKTKDKHDLIKKLLND